MSNLQWQTIQSFVWISEKETGSRVDYTKYNDDKKTIAVITIIAENNSSNNYNTSTDEFNNNNSNINNNQKQFSIYFLKCDSLQFSVGSTSPADLMVIGDIFVSYFSGLDHWK